MRCTTVLRYFCQVHIGSGALPRARPASQSPYPCECLVEIHMPTGRRILVSRRARGTNRLHATYRVDEVCAHLQHGSLHQSCKVSTPA